MITQSHVLLYGEESPVLVLGSVLTMFHHQVRYAKTFGELVELPPNATVDLLIFGACVPQQDSDRVKTFASTRWPQLKSLHLITNTLPENLKLPGELAPAMFGAESMVM